MTAGWILLRGLVRERRHWGDFPHRLAVHLQMPVTCLDLPGNGLHWQETSPLSISAMLESVRRARAGKRHYLLGLSMGGLVAAEWAVRYPQEVAGLVMINSSCGGLNPPWQRMRPGALPSVIKALLQTAASREATLYQLTCAAQDDRHATLAHWIDYAHQYPVSHGNFVRQLAAAARYRCPDRPPSPAPLILSSLGDRLVDPRCSATIARHWNAPLHSHPTAGHDLPHDAPDWVLEQIRAYCAALDTH